MATKQINFRIDADLEAQIRETATAQGMKVGEWLQKVAKQALGHEEETVTSDSNSNRASSNSKPDSNSSEDKPKNTALEERVAKLEATLGKIDEEGLTALLTAGNDIEHGNSIAQQNRKDISDLNHHLDELLEEQTEQNHKIRWNEAAVSDLYQKQNSLSTTVSGVRDELYLLQANSTITDSSNSKSDSSDSNSNSNSASTNSKTDSSNSKPTSTDTKTLSGAKLAKRLGVNNSTVTRHTAKGEDHLKKWTQAKDPEGLAWIRDPHTKEFQVVEGDQNDYKANHKPSDDEHQISNGDKSPNGHQENAPSVEQLEKYPGQTP